MHGARGVTDRGATALKVLRDFQRFSEAFRIRSLFKKVEKVLRSAEKFSKPLPLHYPSTPLQFLARQAQRIGIAVFGVPRFWPNPWKIQCLATSNAESVCPQNSDAYHHWSNPPFQAIDDDSEFQKNNIHKSSLKLQLIHVVITYSLLAVLSHHLKCEMKSPHSSILDSFFVKFESKLADFADFSRDSPILAKILRPKRGNSLT